MQIKTSRSTSIAPISHGWRPPLSNMNRRIRIYFLLGVMTYP